MATILGFKSRAAQLPPEFNRCACEVHHCACCEADLMGLSPTAEIAERKRIAAECWKMGRPAFSEFHLGRAAELQEALTKRRRGLR